jgi:phosphate transport system protein
LDNSAGVLQYRETPLAPGYFSKAGRGPGMKTISREDRPMRERFQRKLDELRDEILKMGGMVEDELKLALNALDQLDVGLARQVHEADMAVNAIRFAIEEKCFELIVTQQPAARDLRAIVAVMNMIVDLERMGDQAKGIAKVIPHIIQHPSQAAQFPELRQMGMMVMSMLRECMTAYASKNEQLARHVITQDDQVDQLFTRVFSQIMKQMAGTEQPEKIEATYEMLRIARELERFGDLATNVAERVIYIVTGKLYELNTDEPE